MNPLIIGLILLMAGGGVYLTSTQLSGVNDTDITTTTLELTTTTIPQNETENEESEQGEAGSLTEGERVCDNFFTRADFPVLPTIGGVLCQAEWTFHDTLTDYGYEPSHVEFYIIVFLLIALIFDMFFMKISGNYGGMVMLGLLIALVFIGLGSL